MLSYLYCLKYMVPINHQKRNAKGTMYQNKFNVKLNSAFYKINKNSSDGGLSWVGNILHW